MVTVSKGLSDIKVAEPTLIQTSTIIIQKYSVARDNERSQAFRGWWHIRSLVINYTFERSK